MQSQKSAELIKFNEISVLFFHPREPLVNNFVSSETPRSSTTFIPNHHQHSGLSILFKLIEWVWFLLIFSHFTISYFKRFLMTIFSQTTGFVFALTSFKNFETICKLVNMERRNPRSKEQQLQNRQNFEPTVIMRFAFTKTTTERLKSITILTRQQAKSEPRSMF